MAQPLGHKDEYHIDATWNRLDEHIEGVRLHEVKNIITRNGTTVEVFRQDWGMLEGELRHMIHVAFRPGALSAWHMHRLQTDHIFVLTGLIRLALFDDREDSPTRGKVDTFHLSPMRPTLIRIPPGVWHGLQDLGGEGASFINYFDRAYVYQDPDEWRLPADTDKIPFRF